MRVFAILFVLIVSGQDYGHSFRREDDYLNEFVLDDYLKETEDEFFDRYRDLIEDLEEIDEYINNPDKFEDDSDEGDEEEREYNEDEDDEERKYNDNERDNDNDDDNDEYDSYSYDDEFERYGYDVDDSTSEEDVDDDDDIEYNV